MNNIIGSPSESTVIQPNTPSGSSKSWTLAEKMLLPASLIIAVLFDRFVVLGLVNMLVGNFSLILPRVGYAAFWLAYLAVFYAVFWKRVKNDAVLWFTAACVAALVVWNFIFPHLANWQYAFISALVMPAVLMAHAQWTALSLTWKTLDNVVGDMAIAWLEGWFIKPFSALGTFGGVSASLVSNENRPAAKRAGIGVAIVVPLMLVIIPLLMGADRVFDYYVSRVFANISVGAAIFHGIVIVVAFALFFSFLWNIGHGKNKTLAARSFVSIDNIISAIVLGSVIGVYVLFCIVQFTYLFARAGLPAGMTYAEYARQGFAQTVAVCAINLLMFGIFLWRGKHGKLLTALLGALLSLTVIMLVSGALRLYLYIDVFGMTWLRLLSGWFIVYLTAVVGLSAIRLATKRIPLFGICALMLLAWFVALGYLNPDGFISWYNGQR